MFDLGSFIPGLEANGHKLGRRLCIVSDGASLIFGGKYSAQCKTSKRMTHYHSLPSTELLVDHPIFL